MNHRTEAQQAADNPLTRQPALALLIAMKLRARQPGPLPEYVPEELREWLLRQKTRHGFHRSK